MQRTCPPQSGSGAEAWDSPRSVNQPRRAGGAPYEVRTRVPALRGPCPRPLDEGSAVDVAPDGRPEARLPTLEHRKTGRVLWRFRYVPQPGRARDAIPPANHTDDSRGLADTCPSITTTAFAPQARVIPRDAARHFPQGHQPERAARAVPTARSRLRRPTWSAARCATCWSAAIPRTSTSPPTPRPEQVKPLFRNCRLIGRRFRLAHVIYGREIIEVATFRANDDDGSGDRERHERRAPAARQRLRHDRGRCGPPRLHRQCPVLRDRGFLGARLRRRLRGRAGAACCSLIGDPEARYREDPVRMLRAVRLAAKLDFRIDAGSRRADPAAGAAAGRGRAGAPVRGSA